MRLGEPLSLGEIYKVGYEITRRQEVRVETREHFVQELNKQATPEIVASSDSNVEPHKGQQVDTLV